MLRHLQLKEELTELKRSIEDLEINLGKPEETANWFEEFSTQLMHAKTRIKMNPEIALPDVVELVAQCEEAITYAYDRWAPAVKLK